MKKSRQVQLKQLQKYASVLEAVRRNEGFRTETDKAFANFWEREGDSLKNREVIEKDENGNTISSTMLGEFMEQANSDPYALDGYCHSPEARQVQQRYGLLYPYHYNQGLPGQPTIMSPINADGFAGTIDGQDVWIFRSPCLQAIRNQSLTHLNISIELTWPKEEIMNIFEMVLDDALLEKERVEKKIKRRGLALDYLPFRVWDMHIKEGKTPWEITQELFPFTQGRSYREVDKNYSPEARSHLMKVKRAITKAEKLISSVTPID